MRTLDAFLRSARVAGGGAGYLGNNPFSRVRRPDLRVFFRRPRATGWACLSVFLASAAFAQPTNAKDCSADGVVVNSLSGAPVVRARVSADKSSVAVTDATGKWSFDHLPCGSVTFKAAHQGYLEDKSKQPQALTLVADVPLHDVKIRLTPQAVIVGWAMDDLGDPIPGVHITVMGSHVVGGVRQFDYLAAGDTNDVGEYRIAGLSAGKYSFCAKADKRDSFPAYGERCYPGPPDAGGTGAMDIRAGYNGVIDFRLTPLTPRRVRGVVIGVPEGGSHAQVGLQTGLASIATTTREDGSFEIGDLAPGTYNLTATVFGETGEFNAGLRASQRVMVGESDVENVHVHLDRAVTLRGFVRVFSTAGADLAKRQCNVTLLSQESFEDTVEKQAVWDESNTSFVWKDVFPGSHHIEFTAPPPFYVKNVRVGGRDITDSEIMVAPGMPDIEVVLSDDPGALEGDVSVSDAPAPGMVILQAEGQQHWSTRTDASGHFKIEGLPPGDYKVYAWDDIDNVEYGNPDWMRRYANGASATIQAGQIAQVKLTRQVAPDE